MYCVSYIKSRKEADMEKPHRLKKLSQLKGVNFADFDRKLIEVHKEIGILKGAQIPTFPSLISIKHL